MKRFSALVVLLFTLMAAGCFSSTGRPPTYPVTGTVTQKGQPLAGATVVFVPAEGSSHQAATGISDAAGKFKLSTFVSDDGAQAGDYKIKVQKFDIRKPTKEEQDKYISLEEEQKMQFGDEKPTPPAKNTLPKKYADEATSGFTFTVKKGKNEIELKLD